MQVDCITNIEQFNKLKSNWEAVYAADPNVTIFVSWGWLRGWFEVVPDRWLVLAARPENTSAYVAFLPLRINAGQRRLQMGGNHLADHTGFVCLPEHKEATIPVFVHYIQQYLKWDQFQMRDVLDDRLNVFLNDFPSQQFILRQTDSTSCPYLPLPESWEEYLEGLSSTTRRNIRYYTRQVERLHEFRVTNVREDNFDRQIETSLMLWRLRWGVKPEHFLDSYRTVLRHCFENDHLWVTILWDGVVPVAGMAAFIDKQNKSFSPYISGYDDRYAKLSPGTVMMGYGIRYAIENGFETCDFLRGDEAYKFTIGGVERFNTNVIITRKSLRMTARKVMGRIHRTIRNTIKV